MNSADADRQIEQMIAFIAQEAKEKAEEIAVKTEKEFMADKLSLETQLRYTTVQTTDALPTTPRRRWKRHELRQCDNGADTLQRRAHRTTSSRRDGR